MAMKYIKLETKTIKVELQQMIAESLPTASGEATEWGARGFDFEEEEEEVSEK